MDGFLDIRKRGMEEEEVEGRILKYNFFCWGKAGDDLR